MDTQTIITAVIVDVILTGIVVFLIQERVKNSYDQKLEKFRLSLQSEFMERQIKFQRTHEKMVTTLETMYQKYRELMEAWSELDHSLLFSRAKKDPIDDRDLVEKSHAVTTKSAELRSYFENNRLHIPDTLAFDLNTLLTESATIVFEAALLFPKKTWQEKLSPEWIAHITAQFAWKTSPYATRTIDTLQSLFTAISGELYYRSRIIEAMYKSIASIEED